MDREKHVLSLPTLMNQRVGHHHASDVNAVIWVATKHSLLTLTIPLLKDIQICIHAAADPERATQTIFSTTHHYFCYRHLNNRSRPTGIKVYSLGINTYLNTCIVTLIFRQEVTRLKKCF